MLGTGLQLFTFAAFPEGTLNGLAGLLAYRAPGNIGCTGAGYGWSADRVLDCVLALALEVSDRGGSCIADRPASDGVGFYVLVAIGRAVRWDAGGKRSLGTRWLLRLRASDRFDPIQPAVCSTAIRGWIRQCGFPADRRFINFGCFKVRTFFRVILPLSVPGLVTGVALSFAHTMGEFGVCLWWRKHTRRDSYCFYCHL